MKRASTLTATIISLGLTLGLSACEDDDAKGTGPDKTPGPGPGGADLGEVELTVSGDEQGSHAGMADFYGQDLGSLHSWEISMHDVVDPTFSLTLMKLGFDPIDLPEVGTHVLDGGVESFSASFDYFPDGDFYNATPYSDALCSDVFDLGGSVTIDSASEEAVVGSFDLILAEVDVDDTGCVLLASVEVVGAFTAYPRRF